MVSLLERPLSPKRPLFFCLKIKERLVLISHEKSESDADELPEYEARNRGLPLCVPPDAKDEISWFENENDAVRGIMGGKK
jgi:hypothetical protein